MVLALLAACGGSDSSPGLKAPANVQAETVSGGIRVSWDYGGTAQFNVYRAIGDAALSKRTSEPLPADRRSFDDTEIRPGESYRYAVTAVGPGGESPPVETPEPVEAEPDLPPPPEGSYRLEVQRSSDSTGKGVVESEPAGISCDNVSGVGCVANFPAGTAVRLSAEPGEGSSFVGFAGPCSGTADCTLSLDGNTTVVVTFKPAQAALNVETEGPGKVVSIPEGIDCGSDCSESYAQGTVISLQAVPAADSVFTGWGGACSGTGGCTLMLDAGTSVTASFSEAKLPPPVIERFTATPNPVRAGESVTLRWEVENADMLTLSSSSGLEEDVTGETSYTLRQDEDTVYTLEASNADGSVTATVEVRVGRKPTIESFSARPAEVATGESSTLTWSVSGDGPIALSIDEGVGDVSGDDEASVRPERTTTYTLSAENAFGTAQAKVEVTVKRRFLLKVIKLSEDGRVISENVPGIDCGQDCEEVYFEDTRVELRAVQLGHLEAWAGCDTESRSRCEVKMDRDRTVYAYFDD